MVNSLLPVKQGISSPAVTSIPKEWDKQWFRLFIDNFLTNADIRNVVAGTGIVISGNVSGNASTGSPPNTSVTIGQAPIANNTVLGNVSGSTAVPSALTPTQLTTLVNVFTSTLSGAAPASAGGTINFLRADGVWTVPPTDAPIPNNTVLGNVSGGTAVAIALNKAQITTLINTFTSTLSGAVPASSGGTTTFLRADASFSVPPTFTSGSSGYAPASGGGTTNFLRADGTWAVPPVSTGANPTASVGLSAVNGAATTFLRSDGAPALDQSIAPTWTGLHAFSKATTMTAPNGGGSALQITGNNSSVALSLISGFAASTGAADVTIRRAGSNANAILQGPGVDLYDSVADSAAALQYSGGQFEIWSGTTISGVPSWNQILKVLSTRGVVINAPASGTTLSATGSITATTGYFATGAAATQLNAMTIQQSGQNQWLLYSPPSSNELRFFNGSNDVIKMGSGLTLGFFNATPNGQQAGWGVPTGAATVANFPGATATLVQCSNVIAKILTDLKNFGLYAA